MAGSPTLEQFERELPQQHLAPLWHVLRTLTPREPASRALPWHWPASMLSEQLRRASTLISAEQAERRVLILENPGLPGESRITPSLYAGVQSVLPGEVARSHRHSATAIRFALEGEGAETTVEDERIPMHPGDFIITPSWTFHEHRNTGAEAVSWLDGLDVPIVNLLSAAFSEEQRDSRAGPPRPAGDALARYGSGLLPVNFQRAGARLPLCYYPYERTRSALEVLKRSGPWDEHLALRLRFVDPTTGSSPIATMGAFVTLAPEGFSGRAYRSTDGTVYTVVEGAGRLAIGERIWQLEPRDVFVIPPWTWHRLSASAELLLFGFSDWPLQHSLGLWREQRE